jgi:transglutaminase-like putative cysteine protease
MRLRIEHTTLFSYSEQVTESVAELRLRPAAVDGQSVHSFNLSVAPRTPTRRYTDRFGNDVRYFNVLAPLTHLTVTSTSEVSTAAYYGATPGALSPIDQFDFLAPTHFAPISPALREFAGGHRVPNNPRETAQRLMAAIHAQFVYEPGATTVYTSSEQALALKRGVCQDFAHTLISLCRICEIPARYVSGYLYSPRVATRDDAASHAWVDIFIDDTGWIALDPTHNCAQNESYVRLGVGRDYGDVPPTRGTFKGAAKEVLDVKVNVRVV